MNHMIVDRDKCRGCGQCEQRCGFKRVISVDETGRASFQPDRTRCIECYHCLMICPEGAISPGDDVRLSVAPVGGKTPSVLTRRSCRVYTDRLPDRETVNDIIGDANMAPRAYIDFTDRQYVVVTGRALADLRTFLIKKIESHSRAFRLLLRIPFLPASLKRSLNNLAWCFSATAAANREREQLFQGAPAVILITGPAQITVGRANSQYALLQLMIRAEERGLGTCISGYVDGYGPSISRFLGLPKGVRVFCGVMIGYPAASFPRYVRREDTAVAWI